jgi:HEPN domain-containing protein
MKARGLPPPKARIYFEKALRFHRAANDALESGSWDAAISAAVHATINALDAACVRFLGKRSADDDHDGVLSFVGKIDQVPGPEKNSVGKQAEAVLSMKHAAEYEDRLCDEAEARRAVQAMNRILERVNRWLAEAKE